MAGWSRSTRHANLRLHCRRRRVGRRGRCEPAVGRSAQQGAVARSRSGEPSLVPHSDRHGPADHQSRGQLALFLRARGEHQWPQAPGAARQAARRLQLDQRHGVRARPGAGLRYLGADGQPRLELRRGPAFLQAHGKLCRRGRRCLPRPGGPAARHQPGTARSALRHDHQGGGSRSASGTTRTTTAPARKASR